MHVITVREAPEGKTVSLSGACDFDSDRSTKSHTGGCMVMMSILSCETDF
jgi:hypothetical protein